MVTYHNLENEESGHQGKLESGVLRNTLKSCKKPQNDGKKGHEDSEQNGREDTLAIKPLRFY